VLLLFIANGQWELWEIKFKWYVYNFIFVVS